MKNEHLQKFCNRFCDRTILNHSLSLSTVKVMVLDRYNLKVLDLKFEVFGVVFEVQVEIFDLN